VLRTDYKHQKSEAEIPANTTLQYYNWLWTRLLTRVLSACISRNCLTERVCLSCNMMIGRGWCESSSSSHHRCTRRGLSLTGLAAPSQAQLGRRHWECDDTRWTLSWRRWIGACCYTSIVRHCQYTLTWWPGECRGRMASTSCRLAWCRHMIESVDCVVQSVRQGRLYSTNSSSTPNLMHSNEDCVLACRAHCCWSVRYDGIQDNAMPQMPYKSRRWHSKMQWSTMSNTTDKSK